MGKGGSAKQRVAEYRMSIHLGLGYEVDSVLGIYVGEKEAWTGEVSTEQAISVNRPDLFGGPKKEGGVAGIAYYLPGGPTQVMPLGLALRRGLTSTTHPAYRGVSSLYFVGSMEPGNGFMWGATPYMQSVWVRARRMPKGLDAQYAAIGNQVTVEFDGFAVTADGVTVTVPEGVPTVVGSHTVTIVIDGATRTYTVDGTVVVFGLDEDDLPIITVAGNTLPFDTGRITLAGVTVDANGEELSISTGSDGEDANPAHIIYECLTNTSWGMGATDAIIDRQSFEDAAVALYNEGFGLSLRWTGQTTIQAFVSEIIDHIQAVLYSNPATGKLTLTLLRANYDPATLPVINPDNADLSDFQRKTWGETVNEMVVTWTNPVNEQEETVTTQDLGNVVMQGGVNSDSRNYYAIRNAPLARRMAERDVLQSSSPLASASAKLDRTQWNLRPGSVVRLNWPEYDIVSVICRVMNIDYGKVGNPEITVSLMEDIFGVDLAEYADPANSGWVDPAEDPEPLDAVRVITSPAYLTSRRLTAADAAALDYPEVYANILAATSQRDAVFYRILGQTVLPNGDTVAEDIGTRPLLGTTTITSPLVAEATSVVASFPLIVGNQGPTVSGFVFIGDVGERVQEIAMIASVGSSGWTLTRGVLDTVPRAWPAGTRLWFYDIRNDIFDPDDRADSETVLYKLLPSTSRGELPAEDAPVVGATLSGRPHLPNRPANVTVGGVQFGVVDLSGTSPSVVPVTWSVRNRTTEDPVLKWTDPPQTPEAGQTTTIRVVHKNGTVITTHAGLTGNSFDIPVASFGDQYEADVHVLSERDDFESLQSHVIRVRVSAPGYGDAYGANYGGGYGGTSTVTPPPPPEDPDEPVDPGGGFPPPWEPPTNNPIQ